jgi:hypothetical protein
MFATSPLVFALIYLITWTVEHESGDDFVVQLEPTFLEFALLGKWSKSIFWVALGSSVCATMACHAVRCATAETVPFIICECAIVACAVGVGTALTHCLIVDFVLINL